MSEVDAARSNSTDGRVPAGRVDDQLVATLVVVSDAAEDEGWLAFATSVASALGLPLRHAFLHRGAYEDPVQMLLSVAAGLRGPVLVLPLFAGDEQRRVTAATLHHAVVASDTSSDVARGSTRLTWLLREAGVRTTTVVAAGPKALPAIWEGPGHNAALWHGELRRRHAPDGELKVVKGDLGGALRQALADAELLVLLWHEQPQPGRAEFLRSVLADGPSVACLLVPVVWQPDLRQVLSGRSG